MVLEDKWQTIIQHRVTKELEGLKLNLVIRIQELDQRYIKTVNDIELELEILGNRVTQHLDSMGIKL